MKLVEIITELYNNDNGEIDGDNCNKGGNQEENGSFTQKLIEVFMDITVEKKVDITLNLIVISEVKSTTSN